jgi:hypothetical protein
MVETPVPTIDNPVANSDKQSGRLTPRSVAVDAGFVEDEFLTIEPNSDSDSDFVLFFRPRASSRGRESRKESFHQCCTVLY